MSSAVSFRPISNDGFVLVLVAVASGILTAPFVISMQSLITHVLAASTRTTHSNMTVKKRTQMTAFARDRGRVDALSAAHPAPPHALPTNLLEGFKHLTQELDLHRASLSPDELMEFNCELVVLYSFLFSHGLTFPSYLCSDVGREPRPPR